METRHFTFEAVGLTEEGAQSALCAGLAVHGEQSRLPVGWYSDFDIEVRRMDVGTAYRDREVLVRADPQRGESGND